MLFDADIVNRTEKVIIEVDGPHHHLFGDENKMLATDNCKEFIFKHLGYTIKRIKVKDWD